MASKDTMPDAISHSYVVYLGVTGMMTFLATTFVGLRFLSRILTMTIKWDDWTCLAALVCAYGFLICTALVATVGRAGYHITEYSARTLEKYAQINLANNVIYNGAITLTKVSMLLFYHRIFTVQKSFRLVSMAVGFLILGYFLSAEFGLIFATNPVEAQWKFWIPHTSIADTKFWLAAGIINCIIDFIILCMPQPIVWNLHLTKQKKILLSGVFCLGGFVCVASIVRIYYVSNINLNDETYALTLPGIWTAVEINTGIICTCLPSLPGLLRRLRHGSGISVESAANPKWPSDYQKPLRDGSGLGTSVYLSQQTESTHSASTYNVKGASGFPLQDMNEVRVQTDVQVKWDGESSRS